MQYFLHRLRGEFHLGKWPTIIIENLLFYSFLIVIDLSFGEGNRFINLSPHPFWIAILLSSVKYGTFPGLVSALIATLFLYVGNLPHMSFHDSFVSYQWTLVLRPLLFFTVAYIVGELVLKQKIENRVIKKKNEEMNEQIGQLTESYEMTKRMKEEQEAFLATQQQTSLSIYESFHYLESLKPSQVILNVDDIVRTVLKPQKLSVWGVGERGFEPLTCFGWEEKDGFARRFSIENPLFQTMVSEKKPLCIVNEEEAALMEGEGILAAPLIESETGQIFGMVKIESIDFLELTVSTIETFRALCELIGMAYSNAKRFQLATKHSMIEGDSVIGSFSLYKKFKDWVTPYVKKSGCTMTLLSIQSQEHLISTSLPRLQLNTCLNKAKEHYWPLGTEVFSGKKEGKEWFVVLPQISVKEGEALSFRLLEDLSANIGEESKFFRIEVESLVSCDTKEEVLS